MRFGVLIAETYRVSTDDTWRRNQSTGLMDLDK